MTLKDTPVLTNSRPEFTKQKSKFNQVWFWSFCKVLVFMSFIFNRFLVIWVLLMWNPSIICCRRACKIVWRTSPQFLSNSQMVIKFVCVSRSVRQRHQRYPWVPSMLRSVVFIRRNVVREVSHTKECVPSELDGMSMD